MKNYFRKSIEFLNDRNIIANCHRVHIKNCDRIKNQNHSRNRNKNRENFFFQNCYTIIKHYNISNSNFSFRNRHRHRNRNEKHNQKRKFYYKSFFESDSEKNIRIVFKKQKRIFIVNKKLFSVHTKFSKINRNRKRKRFRNRKNFRKKKFFVIAIKWIKIITQVQIRAEAEVEVEINIVSKIGFLNSKRRKL